MLTLKNAMNMGDQLLNEHQGERLVFATKWLVSYSQFDGVLTHFNMQGEQIHSAASQGFYETFVAVSAYAKDHGFADTWQVVNQLPM